MKDNKISPLYYDVQTETRKIEFDHFKVPYTPLHCTTNPPSGSWVGIHALVAKRTKPDGKCNKWLKGRTPIARINEHVYLYWIGGPPTAPAVQPKGTPPPKGALPKDDDDDDELPKEDPAF
ncbi:MAG: hypothetical protein IPK82_28670 [Polyangiaceae bacterium]|nr:hypothetical protein [Polyangiaceae bacterium]